MNLHEAYSTAITETVAAVMDPSMAVSYNSIKNNNTIYSYDTSAPSGWTGDGGGGGGGGIGGGGGGGGSASAIGTSGSSSYEASGDMFINTAGNYLETLDTNVTRHGIMNFSDMYYGDERCQNFDFETNRSYWNVTCDAPVEYIVPLYGYSMPFLLITTVLSNSLIVLILSKKKMSTPTNFVLMGK